MQTAEIFKAMGEPTRQQIITMLAKRDMSVGEIAGHFPITRPAIAKHLSLMRRSGLIEAHMSGREHIHHLCKDKVNAAAQWLEQINQFWDEKLNALKQAVEETS